MTTYLVVSSWYVQFLEGLLDNDEDKARAETFTFCQAHSLTPLFLAHSPNCRTPVSDYPNTPADCVVRAVSLDSEHGSLETEDGSAEHHALLARLVPSFATRLKDEAILVFTAPNKAKVIEASSNIEDWELCHISGYFVTNFGADFYHIDLAAEAG